MYTRFPSLIVKTGSAGGESYDSDAQAYFNKGITDTGMKDDWNTFVLSAKAAGYYSKFYYFHPFLGGDATKHSYDAINAGSAYDVVWSGTAATHNSNGVTSVSGSIGNTGFNTASFFTTTSGNFGVYTNAATFSSVDAIIGDAGNVHYIINNGGSIEATVFNSTSVSGGAFSGGGIISVNLEPEFDEYYDEYYIYYDGTSIITEVVDGSTAGGNLIYFGAFDPLYSSTANIRAGWAASSFTPAEMSAFYTHLQTFQTSRGRNL